MLVAARKQAALLAFCCAVLAGVVVAAGGCSSSATPGPQATATPASITVALPTAGANLVFPPHKGFSGQLIVPANDAPAGTNVTVSTFTKAPPGAPAPRIVVPDDRTGHPHPMAQATGSQVIFWTELDYDQAFQFSEYPSHTFTIPSQFPTTNATFELELFISSDNPQFTWTNPAIDGQTITFPAGSGQGEIISQGVIYYEELIYIPNSGPSPSPSPSPTSTPSPSPSPTSSPTTSPSPSPSPSPTGTPSPGACAYPSNQRVNLFVAGQVSDNVIEFPAAMGSGTVIQTYSPQQNPQPFDVVFDHSGNMWVDLSLGPGGGPSTMQEYASPYTGPAIDVVSPGKFQVNRIAFDNDDNLWITGNSIFQPQTYEYAPPYTGSPIMTINGGFVAVNFDDDCDLYVGDVASTNLIEYAPPYTGSPIRTIPGTFSGFFGGVATDSQGDVWVADGGNSGGGISSAVYEYGPSGTNRLLTINTPAIDVAVDPSGDVWTLDPNGAIREFAPPYTGGPINSLSSSLWISPVGMHFGP